MDIKTYVIILLFFLLVFQTVLALMERKALVKMLAARNYPEYKNLGKANVDMPKREHKNMINLQQKKMFDRKLE